MNKKATLFARQRIYDINRSVHAYELLYRTAEDRQGVSSGDEKTSHVITQLFSSLNIETILNNKRAYINFTRNHLIWNVPLLLPKELIVVEILEDIVIDKPILECVYRLKDQGYQLALDDFIYHPKDSPALIEIADVIKIDVLKQNKRQIAQQLAPLNNFKGKLLAEKIESPEQFQDCIDLGFHYFQGFFLNRPSSFKGQLLTESRAVLYRLLSQLNDENISIERVERLLLNIPKLSYRILRLANSTTHYRGRKIESLLEAVRRLGLNQIRNWLSLFLISSQDEPSSELLERTLIRAKMCEALAQKIGYSDPHQAYTVGILSTLNLFLDEPLSQLLCKIDLTETLNTALIHHQGLLGELLGSVISYEQGHFHHAVQSSFEAQDLLDSYLEAIKYASVVLAAINQQD